MKFLTPFLFFVFCILASIFAFPREEDFVVLASKNDAEEVGEAPARMDHVVVSGDRTELHSAPLGAAENVEKDLDAYQRVQDDPDAIMDKRNCCTCEGGHHCCGMVCRGKK